MKEGFKRDEVMSGFLYTAPGYRMGRKPYAIPQDACLTRSFAMPGL